MVKNQSRQLVLVLALSIFIGEILIMLLFTQFEKIPALLSAFLDATLLIVFSAPFLYFFFLKPFKNLLDDLQNTKNDLRTISHAFESNEAIIIADQALKIIRVNKAFEKMTGYIESFTKNKKIDFF